MYQDAWRLDRFRASAARSTRSWAWRALLLQIALLYLARSSCAALPLDWLLERSGLAVSGLVLWISHPVAAARRPGPVATAGADRR